MDGLENMRRSRSRSSSSYNISSSIRRSMSRVSWRMEDAVFGKTSRRSSRATEDEEEALKWAAIEKLPTYDRLRTSIMKAVVEEDVRGATRTGGPREVDVRKLDVNDRQNFINTIFKVADEDNEKFLAKFRNRIDKVGIRLPKVEVRFEHLTVEANCYVGSRALPTLPNAARNMAESALGLLGIRLAKTTKLTILKDVSGILKPCRMTLLLGPPSSGKTTLLLALAGKLDKSLKVIGEVTYNGYQLDEFIPQKTSAYISQNDAHVGEMTVKETLDFSARCQGIGTRYELLNELSRREKEAGIFPEAEVDLFMKAAAINGAENSLNTDYILKVLGLDICKDTIVGDDMHRGISGGQRKRVTTGEVIVGPTKTVFMDEISTGLDSSTTYQIVKCLQQITHFTESTILMSLLQPAPETFDLFDDIILISEGQIVYQGPREHIVHFFESCGFKCPERKGTADFLQEVTSKKDQAQYWADKNEPYRYVPVTEFVTKFKKFHVGVDLIEQLKVPFDKSRSHKAAISFTKYSIPKFQLLKTCWDREFLLIKRNTFFYVFKTSQLVICAIIVGTVFLRTKMHIRNEEDGALFIGALLVTVVANMFNGYAEIAHLINRLPVFYKQRDLLFYPAWAFTIPNVVLKVPIAIIESVGWIIFTYYVIGFAPTAGRFFKQLFLIFLVHQLAVSIFRLIAGVCRTMVIANTIGMLALLFMVLLGGFTIHHNRIPRGWKWAYWISPLMYGYNSITVNEMFASRWMNKLASDNVTRLGLAVLKNYDIFPQRKWYWIGIAALIGFTLLFNILFTLALAYLNPLGKAQAIISEEVVEEMETDPKEPMELTTVTRSKTEKYSTSKSLSSSKGYISKELGIERINNQTNPSSINRHAGSGRASTGIGPKKGMVLPFTALAMSFDDVNYYVDMPSEMKAKGLTENRLQLLCGVTGAFRPGVLTALMGVSGAGKTTLMDVLAGRKTGGYIEGDIRISGFPKKQKTFARISGYCEQTDIHSPQITVQESLIFSAFLRLAKEVSKEEKMVFVDQVLKLVELDNLKDALVGLPGITGLSTEQRKRLTIAIELVANPSIIFMDEPTSGLDARAAAIVMRTVRNTVDTGRTVVCTIHQPSIDIFEAFDELLVMKRGGQVIYFGPLGRHSQKIIQYFEAIPGVPKIKEKYNPATWMLEVSSTAVEAQLGIDFAEHYKLSSLYQRNKATVKELSIPPPEAKDLYFATQYSQSMLGQFKSCIWKQQKTYWRSPNYNLVRFMFTIVAALMVGTVFWKIGNQMVTARDFTMIVGAMYLAIMFLGVNNCQTVQPVVGIERTIFYRERAAGMYSALPYALAQVVSEIPYVFLQSFLYSIIVYSMLHFKWTAAKFFWFFFVAFFTFLYFTYYGLMTISITPNTEVAAILAAAFYQLFNLFSGFYVPRPRIPRWWIWYYWICPMAWTVYGLIASQFGDNEETISVPGVVPDPTVKWYLKNHFGYRYDFMGPVAAVLVMFTVFFAFMFAFCIKMLNFQIK